MRSYVIGILMTACSSVAWAQAPAAQAPAPKLFVAAPDVTAMIANAKKSRQADQPNFIQPLLQSAPYTANMEYRVAGLNANASVHEKEAEMFVVLEGSGTLVTGGTLKDEKRTNPTNLSGSGIEGGSRRRISKGDLVMVPEGVPHWLGEIDGALVLMSIHLPK